MAIILDAPVGGLGDGLLYSTLPELYAKDLGCPIYITPNTTCRNSEVHALLYDANPFIRGVRAPAPGDMVIGSPIAGRSFVRASRFDTDPIGLIEQLHGFRRRNTRPKIWYTPQYLSKWVDVIVVDPRSHSQHFPTAIFETFYRRMKFDQHQPALSTIVLTSRFAGAHGALTLGDEELYQVRDIFEYIDIIYSCAKFVCTEAGGQSLAAAVRKDGIFVLCTTATYNSKFFIYPGVNYTVTGTLTSDFIANDAEGEGLFV